MQIFRKLDAFLSNIQLLQSDLIGVPASDLKLGYQKLTLTELVQLKTGLPRHDSCRSSGDRRHQLYRNGSVPYRSPYVALLFTHT